MACKYVFNNITYSSKEEFIKEVLEKDFLNQPKTLRVQELQQPDFLKNIRKDKQYLKSLGLTEEQQSFLNLLFGDNEKWVKFFISSLIQTAAKNGYSKVWLPTGNTSAKVEGHSTLEEFKKQKEDRIKELEEKQENFLNNEWYSFNGNKYHQSNNQYKKYTDNGVESITEKEFKENQLIAREEYGYDNEINQLKKELERIEKEGFGALKPIYNFYENTVTNILKKQGYNPVLITDEYGSTWNEVELDSNDYTILLDPMSEVSPERSNEFSFFDALNGTNSPVPGNLKNLIMLKKKLLSNSQKTLNRINNSLKTAKGDKDLFHNLLKEKNKLKDYIEGNETKGIKGLLKEIEELDKINTKSPEMIAPYIDKELSRLNQLVKSNNPEDTREAREIIQFIKAIGNFNPIEIKQNGHPIYDYDEMFDNQGNFLFSESMKAPMTDWRIKAETFENELAGQEKKIIETVFNNNSAIKKMYANKKFSYDDIIYAGVGLKDASWVDMMVMDITAGIFSHNGILPQVAKKILDDSFEREYAWSKNIEERLNHILPDVEAELSKIDGGKYKMSALGILGVRGVSFDLFKQKYANGLETGNMIDKYSIEFHDAKAEMENAFWKFIEKARNYADPQVRATEFQKLYTLRNQWIKENTIPIQIDKIPEIIQNYPEFQSYFNASQDEIDAHVKELKDTVGEDYYKTVIDKQIQLLEEYKVQQSEFTEQLMANEGVTDIADLSDRGKLLTRIWDVENNPFSGLNHIINNAPYRVGNAEHHAQLKYNSYVPKQKRYYDTNYAKIEANPILKQFYDVAREATEGIKSKFDFETQQKLLNTSIPFIEKSIVETLLDKGDITFFQAIVEAFRKFIDNIKNIMGVNKQDQFSYAKVNTITGLPEYQVNDSFITQNSDRVKQLFTTNKITFTQQYNQLAGVKKLEKITRFSVIPINQANANQIINLVKPYTGNISFQDFIKSGQLPIGKILQRYAQHQVAQEKSFDLPKVIKLYTHLAAQYSARNEMLPLVEIIKKHYEGIGKQVTNNVDEAIVNAELGRNRLDGLRTNANKQFENWFERVVLGNYGLKKHYGFFKRPLELNSNEQSDFLTKAIGKWTDGKSWDGKVYTHQEKKLIGRINELLSTETEESSREELEKIKADLGKDIAVSGMVDSLMNLIRFKGLGFNLSSGITNFAEGQIANSIAAAQGIYFKPEYIDTITPTEMIYSDFMKKFNKNLVNKNVEKGQILLEKWDILQDSSNELQKASAKSAISGVAKLNPYYVQSKTESYNQIPLVAAVLRSTSIKDKDGNESNVWDAIEINKNETKLKEEFRTEENIKNWEKSNGQDYFDFKSKMKEAIKNIHGDFDKTSGMMAKSSHAGLAAIMFKSWLPREIYKRFGIEQDNLISGVQGYKGRYRSHTAASAAIMGLGTGFITFGVPGAVIAGGIGALAGHIYGTNTAISAMQEMILITKILSRKLFSMPINFASRIAGKGDIINSTIQDQFESLSSPEFTQQDYNNWKANIQEMAMMFFWTGMLLLTKAALWDDDDDKDSDRRRMHNLFANRFIQLSSSLSQYVYPYELYKTVSDVAIFKLLKDSAKTVSLLDGFLRGGDIAITGDNAGQSKFLHQAGKTFLPNIVADPFSLGFGSQTEKQFTPIPLDKWFWNEEHLAKSEVSQMRAKLRANLKDDGLEGEELEKEITKVIPKKKKGQTYVELLEELKSK